MFRRPLPTFMPPLPLFSNYWPCSNHSGLLSCSLNKPQLSRDFPLLSPLPGTLCPSSSLGCLFIPQASGQLSPPQRGLPKALSPKWGFLCPLYPQLLSIPLLCLFWWWWWWLVAYQYQNLKLSFKICDHSFSLYLPALACKIVWDQYLLCMTHFSTPNVYSSAQHIQVCNRRITKWIGDSFRPFLPISMVFICGLTYLKFNPEEVIDYYHNYRYEVPSCILPGQLNSHQTNGFSLSQPPIGFIIVSTSRSTSFPTLNLLFLFYLLTNIQRQDSKICPLSLPFV